MDREPSPETMLAAACCRWPPSQAGAAAVRDALADEVDWDRFLLVVRRHRIEALVWAGLRNAAVQLPERVRTALSARAAGAALVNLRHAAEEARLLGTFEAAGVELVFVKGTSGAVLAYGSLAVKIAWDIDLLVSRADADRASALLAGLGYARKVPDPMLSGPQYRRWFRHSKEMLWIHPDLGIAVELHTALVDNRDLLNKVGMASPRQIVSHGEALNLPTFATEELFAYMCVHGTLHLWARLKWLADVAALIESNRLDCERLYRSSLALGAGRCGGLAMLLCHRFFGTKLPPRLIAELRGDQVVAMLERNTLATMAHCENHTEGAEAASEVVSLMAAQFFVKPGLRYVLAELRYRLFFPYSPQHLSIWPPLWPLLTLLQLPRFVLKRMRLRWSARLPQTT